MTIIQNMLENKIEDKEIVLDNQAGFRKGRSTKTRTIKVMWSIGEQKIWGDFRASHDVFH